MLVRESYRIHPSDGQGKSMQHSIGRPTLCVTALGVLLLVSPVMAQSPTPAPAATRPDAGDRLTVDGEVTKVDAKKGWIDVKTRDGRMTLHFPPAALEGVKVGDRVSIEVAAAAR
jgi:hypothetical protein